MKDADSFKWTPDGIEALRAHALAGLTAKAAGERMGISRCAALGKAKRIGLRFTGNPPPPPRAPVKAKKLVLAPAVALPPAPPAPPPVASEGVTMAKILAHHCRWPLSGDGADMLMCGSKCEDSYCVRHKAVAYYPPATTANQLTRSLRKFSQ